MRRFLLALVAGLLWLPATHFLSAADRLVFEAKDNPNPKHIVLVAGDEEYRTEESMPMLGKILSQKHGFKCTVLFALSPDGKYIDPNNPAGVRGWEALDTADLMIIGTRFRKPDAQAAAHITKFLDAGKPLIGLRTSTHAFQGKEDFGGLKYDDFGLKILGERWVSHHGAHKRQGARGVIAKDHAAHPILNSVKDVFCPSDVYGVINLTDADQILMRATVTESLDPSSPNIAGEKNDPMQPFAWVHTYQRPNGSGQGTSFCTTGGASVDLVSADLRRLIVNAAYHLTGRTVPASADVGYVDPFYPSFYGFINKPSDYWQTTNLQPEDFDLGKSPYVPDAPGSPEWNFRDKPAAAAVDAKKGAAKLELRQGERIALVGGSLAERMNLFGYFETLLHTRFPDKNLVFRNFGWPADEVGNQQRPDNYSTIDHPLEVFGPGLFVCFFGFNEHFAGDTPEQLASSV